MLRKTIFSLLAAVCLLAPAAMPASADRPDIAVVTVDPLIYPVADCGDFTIWNRWEETDLIQTFYDRDGNPTYMLSHTRMYMTFTTVPDTGKSVSAETRDNAVWPVDPTSTMGELRGRWMQIIVPGTGPIMMDVGRKIFQYTWHEDGSLTFELFFNAGPSANIENNLEPLCAYLSTP